MLEEKKVKSREEMHWAREQAEANLAIEKARFWKELTTLLMMLQPVAVALSKKAVEDLGGAEEV